MPKTTAEISCLKCARNDVDYVIAQYGTPDHIKPKQRRQLERLLKIDRLLKKVIDAELTS